MGVETDVAPPPPDIIAPTKDNEDNEDAVAGPRLHIHVKLAKAITHMNFSIIYLPLSNNGYSTGQHVDVSELTDKIGQPDLIFLLQKFLWDQIHLISDSSTSASSSPVALPLFNKPVSI